MVVDQVVVLIEMKMVTEVTTSRAVGTSMVVITLEGTIGVSSQVKRGAILGEMEILKGKFIKMGEKE